MRHLRLNVVVANLFLSAFLALVFQDLPKTQGVHAAQNGMTDKSEKAWLSEVTEILGCHCGCDMTFKECEQDDPDCQLRPSTGCPASVPSWLAW